MSPGLSPMQAASDPMRRAILREIWSSERSVADLVGQFDVSQPAVSFHLRQLREGGFVRVRREGTRRYYQAKPAAFGQLQPYLEAFWQDKLAQLKDAAELAAKARTRAR